MIRAPETKGHLVRPGRSGRGRLSAAALIAFALAFASFESAAAQDAPAAQPYDDQLLRLSEILGAVHYLRELCHAGEGTLWRDQMQALLDSEQPDATARPASSTDSTAAIKAFGPYTVNARWRRRTRSTAI